MKPTSEGNSPPDWGGFPPGVLVVDDEPATRRTLCRALTGYGLRPQAVGPEVATRELGSGRYELLVTDWRMPHRDGLSLLKEIRDNDWPIDSILVTGFADVDGVVNAFRLGALDVAFKPFHASELALRCVKHLQRSRELRAAREGLARTLREQQFVLDSLPGATLVLGADERLLRWNRAATRLFFAAAPKPGGRLCALLHPAPSHSEGGCPWERELAAALADGAGEFLHHEPELGRSYRCAVSRLDGCDGENLLLVEDDTERLRRQDLEARQSRLANIGSLAICIAHELNNPNAAARLQAVNIGLLLDKALALGADGVTGVGKVLATAKAAAAGILTSTTRIASVSNNLLDLGRNEPAKRADVPVAALVASAVELAAPQLRDVTDFAVDLPSTLPLIHANRIEIEQIMLNLLVNACQAVRARRHGEPGHVGRLRVAARPLSSGMVELTVSDNGCGIPAQDREKIFTPYFTTKHKDEGTGLGLSICARIAARGGASLTFASESGKGTTFTLRLPRHEPARGAASSVLSPALEAL
jgi:signal transduction histidine kinase